jgi:hypothetical protein
MRRVAARVTVVVLAGLVALVVIDGLSPGSSGPPSSSYSTAPDGLAAYASLLAQSGHRVSRLRVAPARARLDPARTIVVLDPGLLLPTDMSALRRFVVAGGRLITGGSYPRAWLTGLMADPPRWATGGEYEQSPLVPIPETAGVSSVRSAQVGHWQTPGAALPAIGNPTEALLAVTNLGAGRASLLADTSPLQNAGLAQADNAELGLNLAGPPGRPVVFEEAVHGYGQATGLAALPARWKWALLGLLLAALAAVAARFRRLGPAQPAAAAAPPPRRAHVEAIARALARSHSPVEAAEPVAHHARRLLLERTGLTADADAGELEQAGRRLKLDEPERRAVIGSPATEGELIAAGRALAKLSQEPR